MGRAHSHRTRAARSAVQVSTPLRSAQNALRRISEPAGLLLHCPAYQEVLYWRPDAGNYLLEDVLHGNSHGAL